MASGGSAALFGDVANHERAIETAAVGEGLVGVVERPGRNDPWVTSRKFSHCNVCIARNVEGGYGGEGASLCRRGAACARSTGTTPK